MDRYNAASKGNLVRVQQLVTKENVDARDANGWTVLHFAGMGGHVGVVAWLVGLGADINARDGDGWTPLHYAAHNSHPRCVQLLLDAGADPSCIAFADGRTPLHLAQMSSGCAALLIAAHPAGVVAVDGHRRTPLHYAAMNGTADVCSLLLDAGSIIDAVKMDGRTPLYFALRYNKRDVAELLLDRGARVDLVKLDADLKAIPNWAVSFVARRNACRALCWAMLELARRRSKVVKGNGRDALRLVAKCVWALRFSAL